MNRKSDATADKTLERECESCSGQGVVECDGREAACVDCAGTGQVPTAYGREVLDFVWRHFDVRPAGAA